MSIALASLPDPTKEALKRLVRALAQADAIADYERQQGQGGNDHADRDLRALQLRQANR